VAAAPAEPERSSSRWRKARGNSVTGVAQRPDAWIAYGIRERAFVDVRNDGGLSSGRFAGYSTALYQKNRVFCWRAVSAFGKCSLVDVCG
jgi:hypothetical protein